MSIHETGKWIGKQMSAKHKHDSTLSSEISKFLIKEHCDNVVDFGCGMGLYVRDFNEVGLKTCGYDGNPATPEMTGGTCEIIDLSEDFDLGKKFDWVMSLEVGEHLPKKYEDVYINNLHKHAKRGIIMSWAVPGQLGDGHVNERDNSYIRSKFEALGYTEDLDAEKLFRKNCKLWWFKKTMFCFRKNDVEMDDKEKEIELDLETLKIDNEKKYPCNFCPNCGYKLN
jgi:hypothetical protein